MRYIMYISVILLFLACSHSVNEIETKVEIGQEETRKAEAVVVEAPKRVVLSNCLSARDLDFINQQIAIIEGEIVRDDTSALRSRLSQNFDSLSDEDREELIVIVKEFFTTKHMDEEYQYEAKTEKRFLATDDPDCNRYMVLQNFPESEFAYSFILGRSSEGLVFQEIEIIG